MMKKILCLALVLSLTVLMTGCAGKGGEELIPVETLAPATVPYEAPDGDRVTRSQADYQVFFPEKNGQKLTVGSIHLDAADLKETATALVRNVLAEINENGALRTDRELETVREIPVEISGGICTVNLSSSALQLSYSDYYRLSLALSSTLCSLEEIRYVNVLTSGQSVALDSAGRLPMGSLVSHADENLSVLWEQMEARRTPQGGDPARTALNTQATVYYPLTEGRGIACDSLRITFEGQTASKLSSALLDAMSATVRNRIESANVPDLWEYMVHEPVTSEMEEGGRLITLSFREDLQELADAWKTDIACLAAAVTMTLTTFVPGTAAVCFRIGDKPVTDLDNSRFRIGTILGGLMRRNVFETFLTGSTEVYFVKDGKLIRTENRGFNMFYTAVAVVSCAALIGVLLFTISYLPRYGVENPESTRVVRRYIESGLQETVTVQERGPGYQGALLVCAGGDDPQVRLRLTQAVSALTGLGADKIAISKGT